MEFYGDEIITDADENYNPRDYSQEQEIEPAATSKPALTNENDDENDIFEPSVSLPLQNLTSSQHENLNNGVTSESQDPNQISLSNEHNYSAIAEPLYPLRFDYNVNSNSIITIKNNVDEGEENEEDDNEYTFGVLEPNNASFVDQATLHEVGEEVPVQMDFDKTAFRERKNNDYEEEDDDENQEDDDQAMIICANDDGNIEKKMVDKVINEIADDDDDDDGEWVADKGDENDEDQSRLNQSLTKVTKHENLNQNDDKEDDTEDNDDNQRHELNTDNLQCDVPLKTELDDSSSEDVMIIDENQNVQDDAKMNVDENKLTCDCTGGSCRSALSTRRKDYHHHTIKHCDRHQKINSNKRKHRNPFIAFFVSMYRRRPRKRVADVARQAGRQWCRMSDSQKNKYRNVA